MSQAHRTDRSGEGPVVLITGGAAGLGQAMAGAFGGAGFRVAVLDVDAAAGPAAVDALTRRQVEALFIETDVAVSDQVRAAFVAVDERWGRADVVINNAGITGTGGTIDQLDEADLERVLAVDLKGPFFVCREAVRALRRRGGGVILNIASITARTGSAYYPAYSAAKAGVIALTRSLARNVGRFNIRINCISPGSLTGTGLMDRGRGRKLAPEERREEQVGLAAKIPLARPGRPEEVASFALFLASPQARHVHGAVLTIDGGEVLGHH